ncbi:hypothetical protein [Rhizobium leguminosarum]|uniref:hypothetical protein n=1 Tax=Rhizobium leguminosarum TaxID=384 RepID=UPI002E0E1723|nr:hypothetical protein U8Q02_38470 [Rhizobium leguminosarum]
MPQVVRLPAHVKEGEIRAYWDSTWEGTDVFVAGGDARHIVMMALCAPQMEPGDGGMGVLFEAYASRAVKQGMSMVDKLKAEGYDPATLVFSIMRKDARSPARRAAIRHAGPARGHPDPPRQPLSRARGRGRSQVGLRL